MTSSQLSQITIGPEHLSIPNLGEIFDLLLQYPTQKLLIELKGPEINLQNQLAIPNRLAEALGLLLKQHKYQALKNRITLISLSLPLLHAINTKELQSIKKMWVVKSKHINGKTLQELEENIFKPAKGLTGIDFEMDLNLFLPLTGTRLNLIELTKNKGFETDAWPHRAKRKDGVLWYPLIKASALESFTTDIYPNAFSKQYAPDLNKIKCAIQKGQFTKNLDKITQFALPYLFEVEQFSIAYYEPSDEDFSHSNPAENPDDKVIKDLNFLKRFSDVIVFSNHYLRDLKPKVTEIIRNKKHNNIIILEQ
jgi:glycerophosphoryl diester phosphodiesterase